MTRIKRGDLILGSEKGLELKKHVAAIHSSNKLSLVQRKIANALLFNAYNDLLAKEEHQIQIRVLCNLIGYDSNDYKTIKKALVNLLSTVIEWNLVDGNKLDSEGSWNASSIISDASIEGGICTYSYSNKMKKLLYTPELYGRLNMMVQAQFQSTYGLALYENCIRYQNIEQTPWFDISQFRKLMGVEDGKYSIFRDFKRRVLDKAIEEVNKYSPLVVSLKLKKNGRKIVAIQFLIKRGKEAITDQQSLEKSMTLSQQLRERFGLSKDQIEDTLSKHDQAYILEKIAIVETSTSFIQGKIINVAKYLLRAIADDFQPTKSSKELIKPIKTIEFTAKKNKKEDDKKSVKYKRYQEKSILQMFDNQSLATKKKLLKEFDQHLGKSLYHDIYKRDGLSNVLIKEQLGDFLRMRNPQWLASIQSLEDFCEA
jgi:plasmid replication initiation protein